jgi:hypothetical protein
MVRTIEEFAVADASRLHLTAIRFVGAHPGSELVTKGWAAELPAFVAALDTLRAQLPPGWSWSPTPAWATWALCAP